MGITALEMAEEKRRSLVERRLLTLGYQVLSASSPGLALEPFRDHPGKIDLLLTDTVMPEMNAGILPRRSSS